MQLRYSKTILPPADTIQKVSSLAWSPNKCVAPAHAAAHGLQCWGAVP